MVPNPGSIDINLGAGDTAPILQFTLYSPDNADGTPGGPLDLTGAVSIVIEYQFKNRSASPATRTATIVGAPTNGTIQVDWFTGGAIPSGDYDARFIVTFAASRKLSFPNGPREDGTEFYWLHVSEAFGT